MLHAELRGKLDPNASDLERREDVLTSTVFGTLLLAPGGSSLVVDWFNRARRLGQLGRVDPSEQLSLVHSVEAPGLWFWPSLIEAQPDVLLRIGSDLLVVEAKYGSGKSSSTADGEHVDVDGASGSGAIVDQLLREWRSIRPDPPTWYPTDIREAIASCRRHLVYLVSAWHESASLRELAESQDAIRRAGMDATLWILTWQDLHAVLVARLSATPAPAWVADLATLLERRSLAAFLGFSKALERSRGRSETAERWAAGWRRKKLLAMIEGFGQLNMGDFRRTVAAVEAWASRQQAIRPNYFAGFGGIDFAAIRRVADHLEAIRPMTRREPDEEMA